MKKHWLCIASVFFFAGSVHTSAGEQGNVSMDDGLASYFSEVLQSVNGLIEDGSDEVSADDEALLRTKKVNQGQLCAFQVSLRPKLGYQLPILASLALVPQIEIGWRRTGS